MDMLQCQDRPSELRFTIQTAETRNLTVTFRRCMHGRYGYRLEILLVGQYYFYSPTPAPETVAIRDKPSRTKAACCWGW